MNDAPSFSMIGWTAILVGGTVVVLPLAFLLLRALQRRYRLFTRGTIAFMTAVLLIFGSLDAIAYLNGVRNDERTLRAQAESRMVLATALAVLDPEREPPAGVDTEAKALVEALRVRLDARLAALGREADDVPLELVRVEVREGVGLSARRLDGHFSRNWQVTGWLSDGRSLLRFDGEVAAFRDRDGAYRIIDVRGDLAPADEAGRTGRHETAAWQSPGWDYDWSNRTFVEARHPSRRSR